MEIKLYLCPYCGSMPERCWPDHPTDEPEIICDCGEWASNAEEWNSQVLEQLKKDTENDFLLADMQDCIILMRKIASKMRMYTTLFDDANFAKHSIELDGAAETMKQWAEEIEKKEK